MRRALLALLVAAPLAITATSTEPSVAQALPPGFTVQFVTSVARPTAVEYLPNGRVVVLEQHTGRVRLIETNTGTLLPGFALDLSVCTGNEQGLLGFTDDPHFAVNGRVYAYYTTRVGGICRNRVSAFVMSGDSIDPGSEQILVETATVRSNHNGGDLEVGDDGFLYVSVGDGGADPRGDSGSAGSNDAAQDLSILHGKILRVDRFTGKGAPGNPFFDHPSRSDCGRTVNLESPLKVCEEIYAYGLRNPYRFAFSPNGPDFAPNTGTASVFNINDVGQFTQEEVNSRVVNANYGWPFREGNCPQGQNPPCEGPPFGLTDPITSYPRSTGTVITGGAFVPNGAWPAAYDGGYLFADAGSGKIWLLDAAGNVDYGDPFLSGFFAIADMTFVLESTGWSLWFTQSSGAVRKITFPTAPSAPAGPLRYERFDAAQRPFDTRIGLNPAPLRAGRTRLIELGPDAVGAKAALVNVTFASPVSTSFATAWEPRAMRPATSNLNALPGEDVANASIVPLDDQGRFLLFTDATTDVIVDVFGVFVDASGEVTAGRLQTADTKRVADTRHPAGPGNEYTRSGALINVPVAGKAGVPATGVDSVVLVVAGVSPPTPVTGWLAAHPGGTIPPPTSNLNVNGNADVRTNLVVVPLGADGSVDFTTFRIDDVIVEVIGWFTDGTVATGTGGRFHRTGPTREVDSRNGIGFGPLDHLELQPFNPTSVPDSGTAVAQNLTFAPSGGWGFAGALETPTSPIVTNLNATGPGQTRAAFAITPLDGSGAETFRAESPINLTAHQFLVDVYGWFE